MKLFKWLSKMIISAVLICGISIYTTWYTVQTVLEDVLERFNLQTTSASLDLGDWALRLVQHTGLLGDSDRGAVGGTATGPSNSGDSDASASDQPSGMRGGDRGSAAASSSVEPEEEAVAVWSQSSTHQTDSFEHQQRQESIVMSAEDFHLKKESLTNDDKLKIFSMLISRLPPEDMQRISTYIEDGITVEELHEVDAIVKDRLQTEEYQQLLDIIGKY